jgi:hypothetical protein
MGKTLAPATDDTLAGVRERLRSLQRDAGASLKTIADDTGLPYKFVQRYFAGTRGTRATLDQLDALCGFFRTTLARVLGEEAPPLALGRDEVAWLDLRRGLSADDRQLLRRIASRLRRRPPERSAQRRSAPSRTR